MNRRVRYGLGTAAVVVALAASYYTLPIGISIISLGEICLYSPAGINLCPQDDTNTVDVPETFDVTETGTSTSPVAEELCTMSGVRYAGTTREGAEVCFTLSGDGVDLLESGWSFVQASGCPDQAEGTTHSDYPGSVDASGHFENPDGFSGTVRGATASGVFEDATICPGKTFNWTARRAP
jgi:hypothetical protein